MMTDHALPRVVQYCPSLGKACGIATYTQMLAGAQEYAMVRSVEELAVLSPQPTHVHVQHEFGIMRARELHQIRTYCHAHGIQWYVTMHSVIPLPTLRAYARYRIDHSPRDIKKIPNFLFSRLPGLIIKGIDTFFFDRRLRLWERADNLKNRLFPQLKKAPKPLTHAVANAPLWFWTEHNPDYDWYSFLQFRSSQQAIIKHADCIVVHNNEAKDALIAMGARRVEVIAHGLQPARTSPILFSQRDGKLHVGCFGFLKPHKSILEIIDACALLDDVVLHIYASIAHDDRQNDYVDEVRRRAEKNDWIRLETAHFPLDAIVWRLSQCDVNVWYCTPPGSISTSGSVRQYLAAERPIVAADTVMVSDIRHLIKTVPYGDTQALADALRGFHYPTEALKTYSRHHTWNDTRAQYGGTRAERRNLSAAAV
jgi:glycosyltransferase involved in cell wall biosynthesis